MIQEYDLSVLLRMSSRLMEEDGTKKMVQHSLLPRRWVEEKYLDKGG